MAGGVFKAPAHPQIHPVEIAQQQVALAETGFELQGHQQLAPLAPQGFPLAHLVGVEAAGQLLGEGAATFEHPPAQHVGHQGSRRAHRIYAGMPPEAAVLTGQQCIDEYGGVVAQTLALPVLQGIGRRQGFALAVVEHQWAAHGGETAPDWHLEQRQAQQAEPPNCHGRQGQAGPPQQPLQAGQGPDLEIQFG